MPSPSAATGQDDLLPEAPSLLSWSAAIASSPDSDAASSEAICKVFNTYLEQSALLDPILPRLISDLTSAALAPSPLPRHRVFFALYTAAKTRGTKHLTRLLPHDPPSFRALLRLLRGAFPDHAARSANWPTHYFLLLWLSAAVLVPFPLESIVGAEEVEALYVHAAGALFSSSKVSDGAATFLAAFVTRKDAAEYLRRFAAVCVADPESNGMAAAAALAKMFKTGRRSELVRFVPPLMGIVERLVDESETRGMKLKAKLVQRMGLLFLKERPCTWRYSRGSRMLFGAAAPASDSGEVTGTGIPPSSFANRKFVGDIASAADNLNAEDWIEPAEEDILQEVIEILLCGLRHRDTVVRWSAAKGIGRITGRLPREHAEDVVQAVLDLFTSPAVARADSAWHGGCLALAELCRRGLVLPGTAHFDALFRVMSTAAAFDVRRGAHSVGSHVRDAACYVVWAIARAYTSEDVAAHSQTIAETMIPVSLLDREVNCRRAASAAIQESVGRLAQGVIVEGIELVTLVDYFSLGDRTAAYTSIAPAVASLSSGLYFDCIVNELWASKLVHWDSAIRCLAAKGLASLTPSDRNKTLANNVFPKLLQVVVKRGDALHRHGAVVGLAELTKALGTSIPREAAQSLRLVPGRMDKKGYFKGRVGDMMCTAVCNLIEACARSQLVMYAIDGEGRLAADESLSVLERALGTGKDALCEAAVCAYEQLCRSVIADDVEWRAAVAARIASGLNESKLLELQRGFALAAGALGSALATEEIYALLSSCIKEHGDVEVRRNAAKSLGRLGPVVEPVRLLAAVEALRVGMQDYAVDDRGDVGSWVREASMTAFASLVRSSCTKENVGGDVGTSPPTFSGVQLLLTNDANAVLDNACLRAVDAIVRQSCEHIDRTRGVAGAALNCLCFSDPPVLEALADRRNRNYSRTEASLGRLREALCISEEGRVFIDPTRFIDPREHSLLARNLLSLSDGWQAALAGMVAGCGGVGGGGVGSTSRRSLECIFEYATSLTRSCIPTVDGSEVGECTTASIGRLMELGQALLVFISGEEDRLVVPAMVATEFLVRRGVFSLLPQSSRLRQQTENSSSDYHLGEVFLLQAVSFARASWKNRLRDVPRVSAAVSLLSELAMVTIASSDRMVTIASSDRRLTTADTRGTSLTVASMEALGVVLAGPVPRLRRVAAEALFVVIVDWVGSSGAVGKLPENDQVGQKGDQAGRSPATCQQFQAMDLLADTPWEELAVPDARRRRNDFCHLLSIDPPSPQSTQQMTKSLA